MVVCGRGRVPLELGAPHRQRGFRAALIEEHVHQRVAEPVRVRPTRFGGQTASRPVDRLRAAAGCAQGEGAPFVLDGAGEVFGQYGDVPVEIAGDLGVSCSRRSRTANPAAPRLRVNGLCPLLDQPFQLADTTLTQSGSELA
jgi:hypothetical protein